MSFAAASPLPLFLGLNGLPLQGGQLWFGTVDGNPETQPIVAYWDEALTQAAAQPIRTIDGMPSRDGNPAQIYFGVDHSMTVKDAFGRLVFYVRRASDYTLGAKLGSAASPTTGAGLVAFDPSVDYPPGTAGNRLLQLPISVQDFGAVGDRATDDLVAVNAAIAEVDYGSVFVSYGDVALSAPPTNPKGVQFTGPGNILVAETGGFQQLNTYADSTPILVGREYLHRVFRRMASGGTVQMIAYGDSTVEGSVAAPDTIPDAFRVEYLLPSMLKAQGMPAVVVFNRGIGSTSWTQFLTGGVDRYGASFTPVGDLAIQPDLLIIKYGINEGAAGGSVSARLNLLATNMRAGLTAIRAETNGAFTNCSILLVGPTAVFDTPNGRNEEWFEAVRNVYVQAARDFGCAYFDAYAYSRDARRGAGHYMDNPWADGRTVHMLDIMAAWVWGGVVEHCFPKAAIEPFSGNGFRSVTQTTHPAVLARDPDDYAFGQTWEIATTGAGFPATGLLETYRHRNGYAIQRLYALAGAGRVGTRFASNSTTWAGYWCGVPLEVPIGNFFNGWANFGSAPPAQFTRTADGLCTLEGVVAGGTVSTNIGAIIIPVHYRPAHTVAAILPTASGSSRIDVDPAGLVNLASPNATYTFVGPITYTVQP